MSTKYIFKQDKRIAQNLFHVFLKIVWYVDSLDLCIHRCHVVKGISIIIYSYIHIHKVGRYTKTRAGNKRTGNKHVSLKILLSIDAYFH